MNLDEENDRSDWKIQKFIIYTKLNEKEETESDYLRLSNRKDEELFCSICKSPLNKELSNNFECGHYYHKICGHMIPPPLCNICPICLI